MSTLGLESLRPCRRFVVVRVEVAPGIETDAGRDGERVDREPFLLSVDAERLLRAATDFAEGERIGSGKHVGPILAGDLPSVRAGGHDRFRGRHEL